MSQAKPITLLQLSTRDPEFDQALAARLQSQLASKPQLQAQVSAIIEQVKEQGDQGLLECVRRYDDIHASRVAELQLPESAITEAGNHLEPSLKEALQHAAERIRRYAHKQKLASWQLNDECGSVLGQHITPLRSCGLYVPGGQAAYPSTVLMSALPARIAGVPRVVMVTPTPLLSMHPSILYAAQLAGIETIYTIGGAQAIAALAYGTETIQAVDKIIGPGNAYVTEAKRQVFSQVGIDMLAGPSEIVVLCDGSADAEWVTADLFAQAEHEAQARAILLCPHQDFIDQVAACAGRMIATAPRADIIRQSLNNHGLLIHVRDLDEAVALANRIAPEHLELAVREPEKLLPNIHAAAAIFLGHYSGAAVGDYCAGPNHILPTAGGARFASPLGVYDFQKRSTVVRCSADGAARLGATAACLAEAEGLFAHADAARRRYADKRP